MFPPAVHAVFLKEVVRGQFRFTVQSMSRDLKLRALSVADFEGWMAALQPLASETKQDDEADGLADISSRLDDDCVLDDDYDSDDAMFGRDRGASRAASASIAGSSAAAGLNPPPIPPPKEERERGMTGPPPPGYRGILEKKSGGKAKAKWRMSEKWSKRWFVMAPSDSSLRYYKTEADVANGKDALGTLDCRGATVRSIMSCAIRVCACVIVCLHAQHADEMLQLIATLPSWASLRPFVLFTDLPKGSGQVGRAPLHRED